MSKITGFKKITSHPDKDEVIEKLIAGDAVRKIEAWLKAKYPNNKQLQVSYVSLQSFRKQYLNIESAALKDLQKERRALGAAKKEEQRQEAVQSMHTYQAGMSNFVQDSLIDYNAKILKMFEDCEEGIEHLKISNEGKEHHLNHQAIATYITQLKGVMEMHYKMVEAQEKKAGNQLEEDYDQLNIKMEILTEVVNDVLLELDPAARMSFLTKVKEKMTEAGLLG